MTVSWELPIDNELGEKWTICGGTGVESETVSNNQYRGFIIVYGTSVDTYDYFVTTSRTAVITIINNMPQHVLHKCQFPITLSIATHP